MFFTGQVGQHDNRYIFQLVIKFHALEDFKSVDSTRQHNIKYDHIRLFLCGFREPFLSSKSLNNRKPRLFECCCINPLKFPAILYDEDFFHTYSFYSKMDCVSIAWP